MVQYTGGGGWRAGNVVVWVEGGPWNHNRFFLQERFQAAALISVNRANWLTRLADLISLTTYKTSRTIWFNYLLR